jgi:hypothetical protein
MHGYLITNTVNGACEPAGPLAILVNGKPTYGVPGNSGSELWPVSWPEPVPHLSEPTTALPSRGRKHPGYRRCEA